MKNIIDVTEKLSEIELKDPNSCKEVLEVIDKYVSLLRLYDGLWLILSKKLDEWVRLKKQEDSNYDPNSKFYKFSQIGGTGFENHAKKLEILKRALEENQQIEKGDQGFYKLLQEKYRIEVQDGLFRRVIHSFAELINPGIFKNKIEPLKKLEEEFNVELDYEKAEEKVMKRIHSLI